MQELQQLVPEDKFDLVRVRAAIALGYPAIDPIVPQLLEWVQDANWPVAQLLLPFFASIGAPLTPYLKFIFESEDYVWKYWLISRILSESDELALIFRGELERLAEQPTEQEKIEFLSEAAQDVLSKLS